MITQQISMQNRCVMCNEISKVSDLSRSFVEILTTTRVSGEVLDNFQSDFLVVSLAQ